MEGSDRQSWSKHQNEERHKGSIDLNIIKQSEVYSQRIEQINAVKRKYAVCFGYLGTNYQGLQINPDTHTVESELEKALLLCGAISESNFGFMHKVQWTRAARTDRGVHAATQCCAMKLSFPLSDRTVLVEQINRFLPEDIRVHTFTKVGRGFNAKAYCTKRRYSYLMPTYLFNNFSTTNSELVKGFGESTKTKRATDWEGKVFDVDKLKAIRAELAKYRISSDKLRELAEVLKLFTGTHSFHNYTTGKTPADANAQRYILSFEAGAPFEAEEVEWIVLTVLGQSFLLNQIRRMVSMAVEVVRGKTPAESIRLSLTDQRMDLPMVPGLGLYLKELCFEGYNKKQRKQIENDKRLAEIRAQKAAAAKGKPENDEQKAKRPKTESNEEEDDGAVHEEIDWSANPATAQRIEDYVRSSIHPHIMQQEAVAADFLYYLNELRDESYTYAAFPFRDLPAPARRGAAAGGDDDDDNED